MLVVPFVSADVISLNSGGSNVIVINPDTYIEGFFSGDAGPCVSTTCVALGYTCGNVSDGCSGTLNCGTCASGYTCTVGTCVVTPVTPPGDGGTGDIIIPNIAVVPTEINLDLAVNTNKEELISVENRGTSLITISIGQTGLTNMVILENTSLTLSAGETKQFKVIFVASNDTGIFTGNIIVGYLPIPVSLNIKTKLLLFDSNIVVLNPDYRVTQGNTLRTRVTLVPMGDPERLDVTLNYVIKDYAGKVYLTQSETLLVERRMSVKKDFDTGSLPLGKYIVGLELVYPGGVAPSSAHFEIVQKTAENFLSSLMFFLVVAILIIAILIIILIIRRKRQEEKEVQ
jgi:hypothetical protein